MDQMLIAQALIITMGLAFFPNNTYRRMPTYHILIYDVLHFFGANLINFEYWSAVIIIILNK